MTGVQTYALPISGESSTVTDKNTKISPKASNGKLSQTIDTKVDTKEQKGGFKYVDKTGAVKPVKNDIKTKK